MHYLWTYYYEGQMHSKVPKVTKLFWQHTNTLTDIKWPQIQIRFKTFYISKLQMHRVINHGNYYI